LAIWLGDLTIVAGHGTPLAISYVTAMRCPVSGQEMPVKTSLVPVTPTTRDREMPREVNRPDSGFLAHLIATSTKAPQTRARRRAEPGEAISAYAGLGQRPSTPGRVLSRSL
jgi:hypothetical protein